MYFSHFDIYFHVTISFFFFSDKESTTASSDIGDVDKTIKSSLVLLTPESSPAKDKTVPTTGDENVKSDTDSLSSDPPHCKQVYNSCIVHQLYVARAFNKFSEV